MATFFDRIGTALFRVRWLVMSDRERYAFLWNRTRRVL